MEAGAELAAVPEAARAPLEFATQRKVQGILSYNELQTLNTIVSDS